MNNKISVFMTFSWFFVSLFACGCSEGKNILAEASDIVVNGIKSDEVNAFCKEFKLNEQQVKVFFNKSKIIDAKTMHDKYDYLPCYVYGTLQYNNVSCNWEIRAGGTGFIQCPAKEYIFGCDVCDELLKD